MRWALVRSDLIDVLDTPRAIHSLIHSFMIDILIGPLSPSSTSWGEEEDELPSLSIHPISLFTDKNCVAIVFRTTPRKKKQKQ